MSSLSGKRLVIFGCGYIGSAVAEAALAAGARVEALTRNPGKAATLRALGLARVTVADLASADWHAQVETSPDFVVNTVSSGGPESYRRSYVGGMQSILAWTSAVATPVGTIVYTSSTAVYPQGGGRTVMKQLMPPVRRPMVPSFANRKHCWKTSRPAPAPAGLFSGWRAFMAWAVITCSISFVMARPP